MVSQNGKTLSNDYNRFQAGTTNGYLSSLLQITLGPQQLGHGCGHKVFWLSRLRQLSETLF